MCRRPDHKLLHYIADRSNPPVQVSFVQDNNQTILPVVSGFIKESSGELVEASVFYDSGAQVSVIRSACAEKLGLEENLSKLSLPKWAEPRRNLTRSCTRCQCVKAVVNLCK